MTEKDKNLEEESRQVIRARIVLFIS